MGYPLKIVCTLPNATRARRLQNLAAHARQVISSELPVRKLQLAQLVEQPPEGDLWLHEQKFDGYRILADLDRGAVRLMSRRFKDWTAEFPSIVKAIEELPVKRAILDGEVCVLLPDGRTSFQGLQNSFGAERANLVYFAFDVLAIDDEVVMALPLAERKARLAKLVAPKVARSSAWSGTATT